MRAPIKKRIADAIKANGGSIVYHRLAKAVFPDEDYPRAWGYPTRGGPPGCYMVLSRAIREHGFHMSFGDAKAVVYATVSMGRAALTDGEA